MLSFIVALPDSGNNRSYEYQDGFYPEILCWIRIICTGIFIRMEFKHKALSTAMQDEFFQSCNPYKEASCGVRKI